MVTGKTRKSSKYNLLGGNSDMLKDRGMNLLTEKHLEKLYKST